MRDCEKSRVMGKFLALTINWKKVSLTGHRETKRNPERDSASEAKGSQGFKYCISSRGQRSHAPNEGLSEGGRAESVERLPTLKVWFIFPVSHFSHPLPSMHEASSPVTMFSLGF